MTSTPEVFGSTIQLFLVDGTPNGLIISSIHGWTGSMLVATQATFGRLLARPEVDRTGVYISFCPDSDYSLRSRAYIGEADSVRERIDRSANERGFWETADVIRTSDEALTKGHVRYLEARLIEMTNTTRSVALDNGQNPDAERRRLPEADPANMEAFLAKLKVMIPVIGLDLLKPKPRIARLEVTEQSDTAGSPRFEIRHKSGVRAHAVEEDGEFVVLKGSSALRDAGYKSQGYAELKWELIEQDVLVPAADGETYVFARAYAFRSPSAAAAVVLDRNSNGRVEWKLEGIQQTYHEWQEAKEKTAGGSL